MDVWGKKKNSFKIKYTEYTDVGAGGRGGSCPPDSKKDRNIHVSVCGAKAWIRLITFKKRYCCTNKASCMYGL